MGPIVNEMIEILVKVALIIFLSGIIGAERYLRHKGAGLRTHILIGVGSTLLVLTSYYVSDIHRYINLGDPTRIIAAIVTGIGFLCAGTIIRSGDNVTGLTTSASLWVVSCIGIAVGAGYWTAALIVTFFVFWVLYGLRSIERKLETLFKE
ncbi:MAG: MgtC/SapB family protein [Candidatus Omnitrophota bacterium]